MGAVVCHFAIFGGGLATGEGLCGGGRRYFVGFGVVFRDDGVFGVAALINYY